MATPLLLIAFLTTLVIPTADGHGYMIQPASRSSAWRKGFETPVNTDDSALYCGGMQVQHNSNGGKCGVCGDAYHSNRPNEPGPGNKYATGTIVEQYNQGDTIEITINLPAYHQGYFEFKLCQNDVPQRGQDASKAITQSCLDRNELRTPSGSTRFPASQGISRHLVVLPSHVSCSDCVIQWKYTAGNNWGCEGTRCGTGLGNQETFINCADVRINPKVTNSQEDDQTVNKGSKDTGINPDVETTPEPTYPETTTPASTPTDRITTTPETKPTDKITTTLETKPTDRTTTTPETKPTDRTTTTPETKPTDRATTTPETKPTDKRTTTPETKPKDQLKTTKGRVKTTTVNKPTDQVKTTPGTKPNGQCRSLAPYNSPAMDSWCTTNCFAFPSHCPPSHCLC